MAKSKPTKMLAVLGRCRRTGRWRLASRSSVLAMLGTCHLDMRNSFADDEKLKMTVTVFLGSATFIVPNGAEVRPSGMSLLAGSTVDVPEHLDPTDLPTLEIEWTSIFGRVRIVSEDVWLAVDPGPEAAADPEPEPEPGAEPVDPEPGDATDIRADDRTAEPTSGGDDQADETDTATAGAADDPATDAADDPAGDETDTRAGDEISAETGTRADDEISAGTAEPASEDGATAGDEDRELQPATAGAGEPA